MDAGFAPNSGLVPCLVNEARACVSVKEVCEFEAFAHDGNAARGEGQGLAGRSIVAGVGLAGSEEAKGQVLAYDQISMILTRLEG